MIKGKSYDQPTTYHGKSLLPAPSPALVTRQVDQKKYQSPLNKLQTHASRQLKQAQQLSIFMFANPKTGAASS